MTMKKLSTLFLALAMMPCSSLLSQRYLTEIFDEVEVTANVTYGVNATVIMYSTLGEAIPQPLLLDIYEPSGDTETERPLVLYFHTGNFLPHPQNGGPTGTKSDSATVELCSRLARMGYVVASCDYRLGWNPIAPTQPERVYSLINAAYRGVQDSRTAARFFRKSVAVDGNPYGIDPDKFVIWGQGTGGYIAFASSTINSYNDILIPKFFHQPDGFPNPIPMVIESINGNPDGTSFGINPNDGDTLCYVNHSGYSSDFSMMVNMGGALGDSSWVTAGDIPMVSFHSPTDPFAPYNLGTVVVPVLELNVVEVSGSYGAQRIANELGLNEVFEAADNANDVYTQQANANNDGYFGLYPLNRPATQPYDSAPWEWWNPNNPNHAAGVQTNPDMNVDNDPNLDEDAELALAIAKAKSFCDTIIAYAAPRMMCALALPGNPCEPTGPENDMCVDALSISNLLGGAMDVMNNSTVYTNVDATGEAALTFATMYPCFEDVIGTAAPVLNNSVWFSFTGDGNIYAIETTDCDGDEGLEPWDDTQMAIYTGSCSNLTLVGCGEDIDLQNNVYNARVTLQTTAGTTYYVMVDGFDNNSWNPGAPVSSGNFCLGVTRKAQVSVDELTASQVFSVYPNPSNGQFVITSNDDIHRIEITNLIGEVVFTRDGLKNVKRYNVTEQFAAGVYLVNTFGSNTRSTIKMIVE